MIEEHHGFDRVVILCDESANWQIAGLRQLDRLVLGLDEFAKAMGTANKIEVVVFWKPEIPLSERLLPKHQRITRVRLTEASGSVEPEARILATRLFIARNALSKLLFNDAAGEDRATDCRPNGSVATTLRAVRENLSKRDSR